MTTTVVMIVALVCSFLVILLAGTFKKQFSTSITDLNLCPTVLPEQFKKGSTKYQHVDVSNYQIVRPPTDEIVAKDNACAGITVNTFYATYVIKGNSSAQVVNYDMDACQATITPLCPNYPYTSGYCPCVSTDSSQECLTYQCDPSEGGLTDLNCKTYQAKLVGDCYCFDQVNQLFQSGHGLDIVASFQALAKSSQCKKFYLSYMLQSAMTYLATFLVVVINKFMEIFLWYLNKDEKHSSISNESGSYMLKIFVAQYINMAVVVLMVFGAIAGVPSGLAYVGIFQGTYEDFNVAWYGAVGNYLMLTFIIQAASIPVYPIAQYFFIWPWYRWRNYPSVREAANPSIVMQEDLNAYEVGPVFETSFSSANVLTLVFFAMTYACGLPLLMPLLAFTLILFFNLDKLMICRFNHKPARISVGIIQTIVYLLPYAEIIRLAFGIWMYGNDAFISSDVISTTVSTGSVTITTSSYKSWL